MAEKIKKTPEEIRAEILNQLKNGPKNIAEIGEAINSNWLTIEKFLKELKEEGIIFEIVSSPKMKIYRSTEDLAYYSLPFSEEIRNNSASLLFAIAEKWKQEKGFVPPKTMLQKVAVELIENSQGKLKNIPVLRFHYGQTLAVRYEESQAKYYKPLSLDISQTEFLLSQIKKYHGQSCKKAKDVQYQKQGMEFYKEKEENIVNGLAEYNYKKIESSILKLSLIYPADLKNSFQLFDKFVYCTTILLSLKENEQKTKENKKEYFNRIKEIFYLLWDIITTEFFFIDSEKYMHPEKRGLFYQIKDNALNFKFVNLNSILEDLESEVNSINPDEIESPSDEESLEMGKILAESAEGE